MKPILFNTEMVRAILDGRKTVTRRAVKPKYNNTHFMFRTDKYGTEFVEMQNNVEGETFGTRADGTNWRKIIGYIRPKPPYQVGDIVYVRETWTKLDDEFIYRADDEIPEGWHLTAWKPSLHMPKEAARLFLRVTDVRVDRLQDMNGNDLEKEGIKTGITHFKSQFNNFGNVYRYEEALEKFSKLWDGTIPKKDREQYGWNANPWVWVIEFERCEKPEEE